MYKIYADGACQPNPGECGSGIVVYKDNVVRRLFYGNYQPMATNNVAELMALEYAIVLAIKCINAGETQVEILTDSQYSMKCLTEWINAWLKNNWKNGKVVNKELIERMYKLYLPYKDNVLINHVYGHRGIEGNELADRMAVHAIKTKQVAFLDFGNDVTIPEILLMYPDKFNKR